MICKTKGLESVLIYENTSLETVDESPILSGRIPLAALKGALLRLLRGSTPQFFRSLLGWGARISANLRRNWFRVARHPGISIGWV